MDGRIVEGDPNWGGPETLWVKIASAEKWELFLEELAALERISRNTDEFDTPENRAELLASLNDR